MKDFTKKIVVLACMLVGFRYATVAQTLGSTQGNFVEINSVSGSSSNTFYNKRWLVRDAAGADWLTARLHDGIGIDISFLTPMSNTRTWWERDPYHNIQSWGHGAETYLTLKNGHFGIGTIDPESKLSVSSITNGWLISSKAMAVEAGQINGIKLLNGYPNDTNKWAGVAAIAEDTHSNYTGLAIYSSAAERIRIAGNGNVGIGTSSPKAKLAVEGNIIAKEIKVTTNIAAPDYVFEPDYKMQSLLEIEKFVKENKHLPEIPSAKQIGEEGLDLAAMNLALLKKVEELTLHLIEKDKVLGEVLQRLERLEDNK
ncbi:tail fiber protein [Olivibacter sp. CPCC 100613]|uniref:hypothetical protein n=1 Tax=Olivibacter sp. CPCC 100613 TaxID=3079931 RepID=UPI002FFCF55C